MQKVTIYVVGVLLIAIHALGAAKMKYPYSLIGKDFGILNETDLAANTCDTEPRPFSLESDSQYWHCFESKAVTFSCDSNGAADVNEGKMGLIVLSTKDKNEHHEYIARRPWKIEDCRDFERAFSDAISGSQHICISGSSPRKRTTPNDAKSITWIFEKFKTLRGCHSYFNGECDLNHLIKRGCKISQTP